jgi:hypothetical protein
MGRNCISNFTGLSTKPSQNDQLDINIADTSIDTKKKVCRKIKQRTVCYVIIQLKGML